VRLSLISRRNAGVIAVLHDATSLKSLERRFTQSQKMQAMGQLAVGVAMILTNLLTAISGIVICCLLRQDPSGPR